MSGVEYRDNEKEYTDMSVSNIQTEVGARDSGREMEEEELVSERQGRQWDGRGGV